MERSNGASIVQADTTLSSTRITAANDAEMGGKGLQAAGVG